MTVEVS